MTTIIHKTAIIDKSVKIGENVNIGPYCIVGKNVEIGDGCILHSNVLIFKNTTIGENNTFAHSAVIGTDPQDLKYSPDDETWLTIGNNNKFREFVTINRSATIEEKTSIGDNNLFMAYVHVAHNCQISNKIIIANSVQLAGHIHIEDFVIIGGATAIHQFVKIGKHAFVGGASGVKKDVPPYTRGEGMPYRVIGLNSVGLKRKGFSTEQVASIKEVYKIFYAAGLNTSQALSTAKNLFHLKEEQKEYIKFIESSTRGICRN